MNNDDCDIEIYRLTASNQVGILGATATHRPTGVTVSVSDCGASRETEAAALEALAASLRESAEA